MGDVTIPDSWFVSLRPMDDASSSMPGPMQESTSRANDQLDVAFAMESLPLPVNVSAIDSRAPRVFLKKQHKKYGICTNMTQSGWGRLYKLSENKQKIYQQPQQCNRTLLFWQICWWRETIS